MYEAAFEKERANEYPVIDAFEQRMGFAVDRDRLEAAARVLACPIKKNPPNWQHGRVIYALGRSLIMRTADDQFWLDLGTAKGFSAVFMFLAALESRGSWGWNILTLDVIDPSSREPRNSIEDGKTVPEFVDPFLPPICRQNLLFGKVPVPESAFGDRINFAFIDGSHTYDGVKSDIRTVTPRQQAGDIIMFDDLQVPAVAKAVSELKGYEIEIIRLMPTRKYAIAVKQ